MKYTTLKPAAIIMAKKEGEKTTNKPTIDFNENTLTSEIIRS